MLKRETLRKTLGFSLTVKRLFNKFKPLSCIRKGMSLLKSIKDFRNFKDKASKFICTGFQVIEEFQVIRWQIVLQRKPY